MGHVDLIHLWSDSPLFINFSLVGCASLHIVFPYCLSLHHPPGWRSTREHTLDSEAGSSFGFGQNYGSRSFSEQPDYCLEVHLYKTAWGCILLSMIWYVYVVRVRLCFSLKPFWWDVGMWRLACKGPFFKEVQERCLLPSLSPLFHNMCCHFSYVEGEWGVGGGFSDIEIEKAMMPIHFFSGL